MKSQDEIKDKEENLEIIKKSKIFSVSVNIFLWLVIAYMIINTISSPGKHVMDQNIFILTPLYVLGFPVMIMLAIGSFMSFASNINEMYMMIIFLILGLVVNYLFFYKIGKYFYRFKRK